MGQNASAPAARVPLPGPCVSLRHEAASDPLFERAYRPFDLDDDGIPDVVFVRIGGAAGDAPPSNSLYVLRGRCAHLVGQIPGRRLEILPERRMGLATVSEQGASVHFLCPNVTESVWRFDGQKYLMTAPPCKEAEKSWRPIDP